MLATHYAPEVAVPERPLAIEATLVTQRYPAHIAQPQAAPAAQPVQDVAAPKPTPAIIATAAKPSQHETQDTVKSASKPVVEPSADSPDPQRLRREAELHARLAAEEHAEALRASGVVTAWTNSIRAKVERAWLKPPSVTAALDCAVRVTQVPGGEVVSVNILQCNAEASVRESIEAAVYRASPLPQPPDASIFERVIEFRFRPIE